MHVVIGYSICSMRRPGRVSQARLVSGFSPMKRRPPASCTSASFALNSTNGMASFIFWSNFAWYPVWFFIKFCIGENDVHGQATTITSGRSRAT